MESKNTYYLTTAIDYVNSKPHIGTAYEKITADSLARFYRITGKEVLFLMGADEHSLNVQRQAQKLGIDTIKYCDDMAKEFADTWEKLSISYDDFIRTTEKRHIDTVKDFFNKMYEKGDIYKGVYEGPYCESCEAFIKEADLDDGKCSVHGIDAAWIKEDNYFFKLSSYSDRLLEHIEKNKDFIQPEIRRNEIINVIKGGLEDISVSRSSVSWGISLPQDETQVVYVWFDALINYVSGAGYTDNRERFEKFWPANLHVIGKDITRFHCIIWPTMLMSVGIPLPSTVFGHGFVSIEGEKMSKTKGTVVYPQNVAEKYGEDALRYFLLREIPFDKDGDFSIEKLENRFNSDLANDLGNLLSRVVTLAEKKLDGKVYRSKEIKEKDEDIALRKSSEDTLKKMISSMETYHIENAVKAVWSFIQNCNRYVEITAPWTLLKDPDKFERFKEVIYNLVESLHFIGKMIYPFIPGTSKKMLEQIGIKINSPQDINLKELSWGKEYKEFLVTKKEPLFPRLEKK
ncbi:MAG: methionine--tRNA ligase [Candidatus Aureabacteria bacterium]|nr:methionine--tRNA ligase [Candidatus Auribacterota bacterium]